jgi:hypothetical protein
MGMKPTTALERLPALPYNVRVLVLAGWAVPHDASEDP